ncbi:MAG: hypothetical protein M0Z53_14115 [Thermaerobacter sp.]|nr:hypothetical protein [Thermaerobacter sp.]
MSALGAFLIAVALQRYLGDERRLGWGWAWAGLLPGLVINPTLTDGTVVALTGVALLGRRRVRGGRTVLQRSRRDLVRFWRLLAVYLSAGLTFWQAVDASMPAEPGLSKNLRELAFGLASARDHHNGLTTFRRQYPGPEGEIVSAMMLHGARHGLSPEDTLVQAEEMEDRLQLEEELQRQKDPLWLTVIPAVLLVNVLAMFVAPMADMLQSGWLTL